MEYAWIDGIFYLTRSFIKLKRKVDKVCIRANCGPSGPVSVAWSDLKYFYSLLDGMLVHRRVTPSVKFAGSQFIPLGGERQCESKVSYPRTQHNVPGQGSNPDLSLKSRAHQPWGQHASQRTILLSRFTTHGVWMDGWNLFFKQELYQIKTYMLKFDFHKIPTIPDYTCMYH